MSFWGKK